MDILVTPPLRPSLPCANLNGLDPHEFYWLLTLLRPFKILGSTVLHHPSHRASRLHVPRSVSARDAAHRAFFSPSHPFPGSLASASSHRRQSRSSAPCGLRPCIRPHRLAGPGALRACRVGLIGHLSFLATASPARSPLSRLFVPDGDTSGSHCAHLLQGQVRAACLRGAQGLGEALPVSGCPASLHRDRGSALPPRPDYAHIFVCLPR